MVLSNISFDETLGRIVLINGRSGSGKTTLLNVISGLGELTSGSICIDQVELQSLTQDERSQFRLTNMGIVYQSFNFLPGLSIYENCIIPALMLGLPNDEYDSRYHELAKSFQLDEIQSHMPTQVSGGELQRAAIVRALMNRPKLILADEPSGNLDTQNRDIIFQTFRDIVKSENVTVIMTSHDPVAKDIVDVTYSLDDGRLVHD